jgi:uncharacterized protein YndB with AHSA1/START domain
MGQTDEGADVLALTRTERVSDLEVVVTRQFDGPARLVYEAWTTPELLMRWWTPKSFGITCGSYRFVFTHPDFEQPMAFVGRYLEVEPGRKLVWTNEESEDGSVTTVTFEERDGRTYLTLRDVYPTKAALDEELQSGAINGYPEQFAALDGVLKAS